MDANVPNDMEEKTGQGSKRYEVGKEFSKAERKKLKKLRKDEKKSKKKRKSTDTIANDHNDDGDDQVGTKGKELAPDSNLDHVENDVMTPFRKKRLKMDISLLPDTLDDVETNIHKNIASLLLQYDDGVGGVMLTYSNLEQGGNKCKAAPNALSLNAGKKQWTGYILNDSAYIHYEIQLDALVFSPRPGMKFTGVVSECFSSHVGLLVRSFFNATISSDKMKERGYYYDGASMKWILHRQKVEDESKVKIHSAPEICLDQNVPFVMTKLLECAGAFMIEGRLLCT